MLETAKQESALCRLAIPGHAEMLARHICAINWQWWHRLEFKNEDEVYKLRSDWDREVYDYVDSVLRAQDRTIAQLMKVRLDMLNSRPGPSFFVQHLPPRAMGFWALQRAAWRALWRSLW